MVNNILRYIGIIVYTHVHSNLYSYLTRSLLKDNPSHPEHRICLLWSMLTVIGWIPAYVATCYNHVIWGGWWGWRGYGSRGDAFCFIDMSVAGCVRGIEQLFVHILVGDLTCTCTCTCSATCACTCVLFVRGIMHVCVCMCALYIRLRFNTEDNLASLVQSVM